ncbi:MAG: hypothetical protein F4X36_01110 [Gammaproteobacteria bacterium]|nr:hypothetical protein [Gammaproteobacteria bacterium]
MIDPLARFAEDRARARDRDDGWANLCAVATVTAAGEPAVRVLVLREIDGRLGVFVNATSPKTDEFARSATVAVMTYLPTLTVQYRLQCTLERMPAETVHAAWQMRPAVPKRMDWLYAEHRQSSPVADRAALLDALEAAPLPEPLVAPESATGHFLDPVAVERLDLAGEGGVHDRRQYRYESQGWVETILVP